ncbi:MAG TPA: ABC transporter ATP-binding protein, partial [Flavisolibacter sp.]|nr:ABC transporter ATP-binding protein [Flavisolibacter sp.]
MSFLEVFGVSKKIGETVALEPIDLNFSVFRRLAIAGETGSGKTTLLKIIGGLVQPDSGTVYLEGERVLGPDERLLPGHPRIAYLSQHFELRNNYRVADFLEMASKVDETEAQRIYALCRIDHLLKRRTDQLSGGERQRTALARLLTTSPRLLLLDEPYSNLDGLHKQMLKAVINDIVDHGATSCIMVSHDPNDVLPWAEEILVLQKGRVVQHGSPEQVYRWPATAYAGGLFGDFNLLTVPDASSIFRIQSGTSSSRLFI